jgi:hypothetical protein
MVAERKQRSRWKELDLVPVLTITQKIINDPDRRQQCREIAMDLGSDR